MDILILELLLAHSGDLATLLSQITELFGPEVAASVVTEDVHGI